MSDQDSGAEKIQERDESVEGLESVFESVDVGPFRGKPARYPETKGVEQVHEGLSVAFETVDETASLPEDYGKKAPAYDKDHKPSMADIYATEDVVEEETEPNTDLASDDEEIPVEPEVDPQIEEIAADIKVAFGAKAAKGNTDAETLAQWYDNTDFAEHPDLGERIRDIL